MMAFAGTRASDLFLLTLLMRGRRGGRRGNRGNGGAGQGGGVSNLRTLTFDLATVLARNHTSTRNDDLYP
jgi:hypothetical protein